jgi:hypothetical protein
MTREAKWDTKRLRNYGTGINEIMKESTASGESGGRYLSGSHVKRLSKMAEHLNAARINIMQGEYPDEQEMDNLFTQVDNMDDELHTRYGNLFGYITIPGGKPSDVEPVDEWPTPTSTRTLFNAARAPKGKLRTKGKEVRRTIAPMSSAKASLRRTASPPPTASRGKQSRDRHRALYSDNDTEVEENDSALLTDDTDLEEKDSDSDGSGNDSGGNP